MAQKRFHAFFDSHGTGAFQVTLSNGEVLHFKPSKQGLCHIDLREQHVSFLQSVAANEANHSKQQVQKARDARDLCHKLLFPGVDKFKTMPRTNQSRDCCPVGIEDVEHAKAMCGPDTPALKGKTTRKSPTKVLHEVKMAVPKQIRNLHSDVVPSGDVFFVNGLPFFIANSRHVKFLTTQWLCDRRLKTLAQAMDRVFTLHNSQGFKTNVIDMDKEFDKDAFRDASLDCSCTLNAASANEHVGDMERPICTLKERLVLSMHICPTRNGLAL